MVNGNWIGYVDGINSAVYKANPAANALRAPVSRADMMIVQGVED